MLKTLLRFEWVYWLVACTATVFLDPIRFPFFAALPLFWLVRLSVNRQIFARKQWAIPICGLLVMVAISAFVTPDLDFSLRKIAGLVQGIGLFVALGNRDSQLPYLPHWLILIFGLVVTGAGAIGADIYARIPILFPLFRAFYRVVPLLPSVNRILNANLIGGSLLLTLLPSFGLAILSIQRRKSVFAIAAVASTVIQAGFLLITQSRSALLGAFIACLAMLAWLKPSAKLTMRWVVLFGILLAVLLFLPIWPSAVQEQLRDVYFSTLVKGDEGEQGLESIEARLIIWNRAIEVISERPVTGVGMNIFRTIANEPEPILPRGQAIPHAHNWALQIVLELGLLGLTFYLWMVIGALNHLTQMWRASAEAQPLTAGYGGAIVAFMIFGLLDTVAPGARPEFVFWLMLAGAFAIRPEPVAESP